MDPVTDGPADPTIIFNRREKKWMIVYTQRRANVAGRNVNYCYGTRLGVAQEGDPGRPWVYHGTLDTEFETNAHPAPNTFWAPEIIWVDGRYHMYVSYIRGIHDDFGNEKHIVHMTSTDFVQWTFESILPLSSRPDRSSVIDACVHRLPDNTWRMWYKDELGGQFPTHYADSRDLYTWEHRGPVQGLAKYHHEGVNVFHFRGHYWLIADPDNGLLAYRSEDAERWEDQHRILEHEPHAEYTPGTTRPYDFPCGKHADVLVTGDDAYIFYFTHPHWPQLSPFEKMWWTLAPKDKKIKNTIPFEHRRTVLQVARLDFVDGRLACERNKPFTMKLPEEI
jgi:hypothetical protein